MRLPRESEMRGALNRYCAYLNTQQAMLAEVRTLAREIDYLMRRELESVRAPAARH